MGEKTGFRLALAAAIAMLAIGAMMGVTAPPCNPLPMSTMTAFELVRSVADLQRIFGEPEALCRAPLVEQLRHANVIDTYAYIPAYTAFFALTAYALGRRDRMLGWIAVAIAIVCAVADVVENMAMFNLGDAPDTESPWIMTLVISTNVKWVGLAVTTTLCGVMLMRRGGFGWVALLACAAPLVSSIWAVISPDAAGQYLIPGMVVASVMLLAVAAVGAFHGDKAAGAVAPPSPAG